MAYTRNPELMKEDIKFIVENWEKFSNEDLSKKLGYTEKRLDTVVSYIKRVGGSKILAKKNKRLTVDQVVKEALTEMGKI